MVDKAESVKYVQQKSKHSIYTAPLPLRSVSMHCSGNQPKQNMTSSLLDRPSNYYPPWENDNDDIDMNSKLSSTKKTPT